MVKLFDSLTTRDAIYSKFKCFSNRTKEQSN